MAISKFPIRLSFVPEHGSYSIFKKFEAPQDELSANLLGEAVLALMPRSQLDMSF
jgi:hypothetical protein